MSSAINDPSIRPQFVRLGETDRKKVTIALDGRRIEGLSGDTLLTLLLLNGQSLRRSEFGDGPRAGFCNMGTCQDCWVVLEGGRRVRACSTYAADGMRLTRHDKRWMG